MAHDFVLRRQLGEPTHRFRGTSLKAALFLCLLTFVFFAQTEVKADLTEYTLDKLPASSLKLDPPIQGETLELSALVFPSDLNGSAPAGQDKTKIQIHISNQPELQEYIRFYNGKGRSDVLRALERSWVQVQMMAGILESHGVPAELVYVVLVESCFNHRARSSEGPVGYWQFLGATARSLGLRVDGWVDERLDPIRSTQAAARYLRSFHDRLRSWPLSIAAYNAGQEPVLKAVNRCRSNDFWEIYRRGYLPSRTRQYVLQVMAAIQVTRDWEIPDFRYGQSSSSGDFESVWVKPPLRLEQVSKWTRVPVSHLRDLNPSLRKDCIPPRDGFFLRLPLGARKQFVIAYEDYLQD